MSLTDINANSGLTAARELPDATDERGWLCGNDDATWVYGPQWTLRSVLAHLAAGRVAEAVAQFADHFRFDDHTLALEFNEGSLYGIPTGVSQAFSRYRAGSTFRP